LGEVVDHFQAVVKSNASMQGIEGLIMNRIIVKKLSPFSICQCFRNRYTC